VLHGQPFPGLSTPMRLFTPIGYIESGHWGLQFAQQCLHFYNEYFDLPYVLPKLDVVACPDFANVAMENFGLILFSFQTLLVEEGKSSTSDLQYGALIIAHEIAHQWFGNYGMIQLLHKSSETH
jgi:puromycin-sensitive aminopeptidase